MTAAFERPMMGIPAAEMEILSEIVLLRLSDPAAEQRRVRLVRELLWAGGELRQALLNHTRHAMVDCSGTPGTGDLAADTRALRDAFQRYSDLLRGIAAEFGPAVGGASRMPAA